MTEIRILSAKDVAACLTMDEVIDAVRVANPHNPERARAFVETLPGRTSAEDVTVFDSAGTALFDIACAKIALDAAARRGLGTVAEL